jgi:cytochrome c-type biogenesis protein CcmF
VVGTLALRAAVVAAGTSVALGGWTLPTRRRRGVETETEASMWADPGGFGAADPVAADPVGAESVGAESVGAESVCAESVCAESVAARPVAARPVAAGSVAARPVAARPVAAGSVAAADSLALGSLALGSVTLASVALALGSVALALVTVAVGALVWSLLTGNFALAYVADTTTRQGSWPYRLAGLWGGNGGSLLLWGWIILAAGIWATRRRPAARLVAIAAGGSVVLVAAVTADPFRRLAIPAIDGGGLTPILQYPAMLYHPLLLYTGHAGLVAPFALALAALATRRLDTAWLATTRKWMLAAWLLLGIGLVTGAHWSYVEVGWGGFWAWDPVENSGLLPWLAAIAFLHAARRSRIDGDREVPASLAAMAALPFCFSLLGAAVSRSGAAQSVHAFAEATTVGQGLLALLVAAVTAVAGLWLRAQRRHPQPAILAPAGRQSMALAGGVVLLLAVAVVVAFGTVFPVLAHAVTGQTVDVTARYFATVVTPLAVAAVLLMGVAPSLRRRPGQRSQHIGPARWIVAGAAAVVATAGLAPSGRIPSVALGVGATFAGVLTGAEILATRSLRRAGALTAHLGAALLLLGVAGSLLGSQSRQTVRPGGALQISGYAIRYRQVVVDQGPGWQRARTILEVDRGGRQVAVLRPGLRIFAGQTAALSDVAIRATPGQDLIVAVGTIDPATEAADLNVTVRPLVFFVWWGGLLAAAGGAVVLGTSLRPRNRRREVAPAQLGPPAPDPRPVPVGHS